ncbi:MAG: glycosyltransferase family 2 protein [Patescibacteria group bacterium]|nr:glycosyltransferase family 2 protein [Patescibacteria group bacterium]
MTRVFEFFPGTLSWLTLFLVVFLSWQKPVWIAFFIIVFDVYWLCKSIYLSLHLRATFNEMKVALKTPWRERLGIFARWESLYHLVVLPMATEPYAVVKESIESLARSNYPHGKLLVVLAIEERAGAEARETADRIHAEFAGRFPHFLVTTHPADLPGEIPGKGSNESWATAEAVKVLVDGQHIPRENVLVSVFDADTQIYPEYFGCLTYHFLTAEHPQRSSFQPVPLFTNNIYQAPALARVISFSATFWQMMQQSRPERLTTFSSHAMPLPALIEIGYWHKDIVSEDSRIFWQCYLHYHGDWRVEPLFYPVSMDANVAPTFWGTMVNLYKQQRRWAWGVENLPYMFNGFMRDARIGMRAEAYWAFNGIEGFHSWATNSLIIFALGWLPVLIGTGNFNQTILSYNLPNITRYIMLFASIGIVSSAVLSVMLLPPKPEGIRVRHYALYLLEWILMPITLIIFGAFPALEAQTRLMLGGKYKLGFWVTPKSREAVE